MATAEEGRERLAVDLPSHFHHPVVPAPALLADFRPFLCTKPKNWILFLDLGLCWDSKQV